MATSKFPLLKLPLIPLEPIIEQLDFLDLLHLSMKSSKFKRLLELLKLSVQTMNFLNIGRSYGISIMQNGNRSYIYAYDYVPKGTVTEHANIQGEPVHIWKDDRERVKVKSDLSRLATLETIIKHVLSITKVAKYTLTTNNGERKISNLFIWQKTTQMDQLHISPKRGSSVHISPENLVFILEEISVDLLHLRVYCPDFKYQKPIKHSVIKISRPSWIDFDQFSLGAETITADFSDQKVSNAVLNRLIKDWTEGKNPKLRKVEFTWEDNDPESLAMAREHEARPPKPVLPNRNIEQLNGLCIKKLIKYHFCYLYVRYEVRLSVEEDFGLNGTHLEDQA